jgi:hypothetical protein
MKVIKDIIKKAPSACSAWAISERKDGKSTFNQKTTALS